MSTFTLRVRSRHGTCAEITLSTSSTGGISAEVTVNVRETVAASDTRTYMEADEMKRGWVVEGSEGC